MTRTQALEPEEPEEKHDGDERAQPRAPIVGDEHALPVRCER